MSSLPESLLRFRTELEDAIRRELEAEAASRSNGWGARVLRAIRRRPGRTTLAFAAVAGAAAAALFVSSPWKTPPGFLEQVQAAITPRAGTVLHMKLVMTMDMVECSVTHPPLEMWVDLTPPYNWRSFDVKQTELCKAGTTIEIGGETTSRKPTLVFVPPNTLTTTREWPGDPSLDPDPFGDLRQAIDDGTAHREGTTVLDGRTVERIRIDCDHAKFPLCEPIYAFVDPETFLPVRTMAGPGLRPGPGASCKAPCFFQDFVTYEYLPGTPAYRALADIRAQHPDATGPTAPAPAVPVLKLTGAVAKTVRAAKGAKSARVTFEVTATNADGDGVGAVWVWCEPRSGSRFPLGRTIVRCGATDPSGNSATAQFTVTVRPGG